MSARRAAYLIQRQEWITAIAKIVAVLSIALIFVVICFGVWFFFYGYHEKTDVIVAANSDGTYKRWMMRRNIETYVSDTNCTTNSKHQRRCSTDYDWEVINFADTSGLFGIDEPVEPLRS